MGWRKKKVTKVYYYHTQHPYFDFPDVVLFICSFFSKLKLLADHVFMVQY